MDDREYAVPSRSNSRDGTSGQARSDRWLRAIGYGLLAVISTIIVIIVVTVPYRNVLCGFARHGLPHSMIVPERWSNHGRTLFTFLRPAIDASARAASSNTELFWHSSLLPLRWWLDRRPSQCARAYIWHQKKLAPVFAGTAYGVGWGETRRV